MELHLPPKPQPVVGPGEFQFAAVGLEHGHIYGMTNGLLEAGATLTAVWDEDPEKVAAYRRTFPQARAAASLDELLADPEHVMSEGLEAFAPKYRADGALLIQAHPFRGKCTPAPAELLDGVEVLNLNPRHDSHNDLALAYAEEHHLLMTAGSDCHRPGDEGTTGILAETLPEDSFGFADLIRSGKYTLIRPE